MATGVCARWDEAKEHPWSYNSARFVINVPKLSRTQLLFDFEKSLPKMMQNRSEIDEFEDFGPQK